MTATTAQLPVACSCGERFTDGFAAGKHRDRIPAADRKHHTIALPPVAGRQPLRTAVPPQPLRAVPEHPSTGTPPQIIWEDPPPVQRGPGGSTPPIPDHILHALKERPGNWARIRDYTKRTSASSFAARVNKKDLLGPGWEATARRTPTGSALWLRWVGTEP